MSGGRHPSTPRTVTGRAMTILGAFSPERPAMGVKEISRRTGLAKSTTHRLVSELVEWGALSRGDEHGDEYTYRGYNVGNSAVGNFTVTPPSRQVVQGTPVDFTLGWNGLAADQSYLGWVNFTAPNGTGAPLTSRAKAPRNA